MEHSLCFPCTRISPYRGEPLTGEPDAGDPPVRFGGRGERNQSFLPTPIFRSWYCHVVRFKLRLHAAEAGGLLPTVSHLCYCLNYRSCGHGIELRVTR